MSEQLYLENSGCIGNNGGPHDFGMWSFHAMDGVKHRVCRNTGCSEVETVPLTNAEQNP